MKSLRKRKRKRKIKLALGVPHNFHTIYTDASDSLWMLDKPVDLVKFNPAGDGISEMRNRIVDAARHNDCSHVLMLDSDMVYPRDTIAKLLSHEKDIVGGLTFRRYPPFEPQLKIGDPYRLRVMYPYPEGLVKVTATGAGCLLIDMRVFDAMEQNDPSADFFETSLSPEGKVVGEDINFCYRARDLDIDIYVDTTVKTDHLFLMRANENWFELYKALNIDNKQEAIGGV